MKHLLPMLLFIAACGRPFTEGPLQFGTSLNSAVMSELNDFLATKSCLRCHTPAQLRANIVPGDPAASKLYQRVADGSMPQAPLPALSAEEVAKVRQYIIDLAPRGPTPLTGYALLKQTFIDSKCVICHKGLEKEDTIPQAWLVKGAPEQSRLYTAVASDRMPKWYEHATSTELQLVSDYISQLNQTERSVTHTEMFDELLQPKCLKCHGNVRNESGIANWVVAGRPQESKLFEVLQNTRMPKHLPKTTPEEKAMLFEYIKGLK